VAVGDGRARTIIVGAGIGGLTAAIALRQAGADPLVVERAPSLEALQLGAGLHLWTNALQALRQLGLAEQVAAIGTPMRTQRYLDWRGRSLGTLDVEGISHRLGAPTVGVSRPQFHRVLADALDGTQVRLGAACVGFEQDRRGVTVRFDDGTEERGDVLVGADGIGSVVRRQLHGPTPPVYAGYTAWRAICDFSHPRVPVGEMWIHWGRGARILHYHVSGQRLYWLALVKAPQGGSDPPGGRRRAVTERYRGWPEPIEAMLASTDESAISRADVVDRDPIGHWGTGRVTLLGDAAHPMTPNLAQGAGQAIEDGVALARALDEDADAVAALRTYEQRRAERANGLSETSRMVGRLSLLSSPLTCAARDNVALRTVYATYGRTKAVQDLTALV
jgi:2-polyprenyl-6-methoxyphenol hydroxylase-like FAD-dependent oxidoreductase